MYLRGAAIRPVPPWAILELEVLQAVERELARDGDRARKELDEAFNRFEQRQPQLADKIGDVLSQALDETALALGYFLSIALFLSFERAFPNRIREVNDASVTATEAAIALEEELRAGQASGPFDLDDVMATAQPGVLAFIHEHIEAALESPPRTSSPDRPVDREDVHDVYRAILMLTLALSHAVMDPDPSHRASDPGELQA